VTIGGEEPGRYAGESEEFEEAEAKELTIAVSDDAHLRHNPDPDIGQTLTNVVP
jgi:hypothetical protein